MGRQLRFRLVDIGNGYGLELGDNEVIRHIGFAGDHPHSNSSYTTPTWMALVVTSEPWTAAERAELVAMKLWEDQRAGNG